MSHSKDNITVPFAGHPDFVPSYATDLASGADLYAYIKEDIALKPGERILIPTGISMAIPSGWEGQVRPRSGLALKKGLTLLNSPGTIDADYRGEIQVLLINLGSESVRIVPRERIAQIVIARVSRAEFDHIHDLSKTLRGVGGFGSTG